MEKKAKLEKAIEIFVLVALPIALIAGCAGSGNLQPDIEKKLDTRAIEQSYNMQDIYPLFAKDENNLAANKLVEEMTVATTDGLTISDMPKSSDVMMKVSFFESADKKDHAITTSSAAMQDQPLLLVADTSDDVLTAGANSKLALMNDIQLQPIYVVFNFDTDSATVHEYDQYFLKQHAEFLKSNPGMILKVSGHTDSRGSKIYNEELSKRRSTEITKLLVSFGASESQIQTTGFGENTPVIDENSWEENRRVELQYIENTMVSVK